MYLSLAHFTRQSFLTCALEGFSLTHAYAPEFPSLRRGALRLWVWPHQATVAATGTAPLACFRRLPLPPPPPRFPFPPSRFFPSPCSLFCLVSFFPTGADPCVVSQGSGWWERAIFSWKQGGVGNTVNWGIWRPRACMECFVCCKRLGEGGKEVFPRDKRGRYWTGFAGGWDAPLKWVARGWGGVWAKEKWRQWELALGSHGLLASVLP